MRTVLAVPYLHPSSMCLEVRGPALREDCFFSNVKGCQYLKALREHRVQKNHGEASNVFCTLLDDRKSNDFISSAKASWLVGIYGPFLNLSTVLEAACSAGMHSALQSAWLLTLKRCPCCYVDQTSTKRSHQLFPVPLSCHMSMLGP